MHRQQNWGGGGGGGVLGACPPPPPSPPPNDAMLPNVLREGSVLVATFSHQCSDIGLETKAVRSQQRKSNYSTSLYM